MNQQISHYIVHLIPQPPHPQNIPLFHTLRNLHSLASLRAHSPLSGAKAAEMLNHISFTLASCADDEFGFFHVCYDNFHSLAVVADRHFGSGLHFRPLAFGAFFESCDVDHLFDVF